MLMLMSFNAVVSSSSVRKIFLRFCSDSIVLLLCAFLIVVM
jgi:hypothetical protein